MVPKSPFRPRPHCPDFQGCLLTARGSCPLRVCWAFSPRAAPSLGAAAWGLACGHLASVGTAHLRAIAVCFPGSLTYSRWCRGDRRKQIPKWGVGAGSLPPARLSPGCGGRWSPDCPRRGQCWVSRTCSGGGWAEVPEGGGNNLRGIWNFGKTSKVRNYEAAGGAVSALEEGNTRPRGGHFPGVSRGRRSAAWVPQDQSPGAECPALRWVGLLCRYKWTWTDVRPPLRAEPARQRETHPVEVLCGAPAAAPDGRVYRTRGWQCQVTLTTCLRC